MSMAGKNAPDYRGDQNLERELLRALEDLIELGESNDALAYMRAYRNRSRILSVLTESSPTISLNQQKSFQGLVEAAISSLTKVMDTRLAAVSPDRKIFQAIVDRLRFIQAGLAPLYSFLYSYIASGTKTQLDDLYEEVDYALTKSEATTVLCEEIGKTHMAPMVNLKSIIKDDLQVVESASILIKRFGPTVINLDLSEIKRRARAYLTQEVSAHNEVDSFIAEESEANRIKRVIAAMKDEINSLIIQVMTDQELSWLPEGDSTSEGYQIEEDI
jgi:hypothetical protein